MQLGVVITLCAIVVGIVGYRLYQRSQLSRALMPFNDPQRLQTSAAEPADPSVIASAPVERERILKPGRRIFFALRPNELVVLLASTSAPITPFLKSSDIGAIREALAQGTIAKIIVRGLDSNNRIGPVHDVSGIGETHGRKVQILDAILALDEVQSLNKSISDRIDYWSYLSLLRNNLDLIDFLYGTFIDREGAEKNSKPPFDDYRSLPSYLGPQPKKRSVVFLHNNYYQFYYLAKALRKRGWDAITVSLYGPDGPDNQFFHGEDLNLHDKDPDKMGENVREFLRTVPDRFGALHFYGQGVPSFFALNHENTRDPQRIPWDFLELKRRGVTIGYTPTGCQDGVAQSTIKRASGTCQHCVWEYRPDVCSDAANEAWARKLDVLCDWVSLDGDWALDARTGPKFVRSPVTTTLDPEMWRPNLEPPEDMRVERAPGEILIYHAVGNYEARRAAGRDIKGTGAVIAAIDRLKAEGVPVRLVFATDVPSTLVRYLQVQADIVVDQLNYGRHGANARECMMLGKPVVARVIADQGHPLPPLAYLEQSPAIRADEDSVYAVLKGLIQAPETWAAIGARSRAFAEHWHDADKCALRFERIIDRVQAGLVPEDDAVFE